MGMFYLICLVMAVSFAAVCIALWMSTRKRTEEQEKLYVEREQILKNQLEQLQSELAAERNSKEELRTANQELRLERERLRAQIEQYQQKAEQDKQELEKLQASFRAEFKSLASEMLEERSKQFKERNDESMKMLIEPFRNNIKEFKERVETIFTTSNEQHGTLRNELRNLMELNRRITEETNNLTTALKGNSKTQGDWGEAILERILEGSNLHKGIHYHTQASIKNEEGKELRPDVIIDMPDGKQVAVDSKVSLRDYVKYTEAETEQDRREHLEAHAKAIRNHVAQLGSKKYQELLAASPDFVIMFVANEAAFYAALQADESIWAFAYEKKVIIASPNNLLAMLKIIDDLWKRDAQSKNALEIAKKGGLLYDKFVGFVKSLEAIGRNLSQASDNYENAMKQLSTGRGSLISKAQEMKILGAKASKSIPDNLLEAANIEPDEEEETDSTLSIK